MLNQTVSADIEVKIGLVTYLIQEISNKSKFKTHFLFRSKTLFSLKQGGDLLQCQLKLLWCFYYIIDYQEWSICNIISVNLKFLLKVDFTKSYLLKLKYPQINFAVCSTVLLYIHI